MSVSPLPTPYYRKTSRHSRLRGGRRTAVNTALPCLTASSDDERDSSNTFSHADRPSHLGLRRLRSTNSLGTTTKDGRQANCPWQSSAKVLKTPTSLTDTRPTTDDFIMGALHPACPPSSSLLTSNHLSTIVGVFTTSYVWIREHCLSAIDHHAPQQHHSFVRGHITSNNNHKCSSTSINSNIITYTNQVDVVVEPKRTFIDCRRAAEKGELTAQFELGWMYEHGFRVPRDYHRAIRWYVEAARMGHALAQYHLGLLFETQEFEEQPMAATFQAQEEYNREDNKEGRQGDEANLARLQQQHQWTAVEWYAKAAKQGIAGAQYKMGALYDPRDALSGLERKEGKGRDGKTEGHNEDGKEHSDLRKAIKWYRRAAVQGHAEAQYRLGSMYEEGRGVYRETTEAYRWLLRAAEQGHRQAQTHLGWMLEQGMGIEGSGQDDVQAVVWYRRAADQGDVDALFRLGEMFEQGGRGIGRDDCKAMACYIRAKARGHLGAERRYQVMRRKGRGVHQLPVVGPDWVRAVPNYLWGCAVTCQQVFRRVMDSDESMYSSSMCSELEV